MKTGPHDGISRNVLYGARAVSWEFELGVGSISVAVGLAWALTLPPPWWPSMPPYLLHASILAGVAFLASGVALVVTATLRSRPKCRQSFRYLDLWDIVWASKRARLSILAAALTIVFGLPIFLPSAESQPNQSPTVPLNVPPIVNNAPSINTFNQTGGTNTVVVGPGRLMFDPAIGEALVSKLPSGKPIELRSVGSATDQAVADQYQQFLQKRGFQTARASVGMMVPPPDHPISIFDAGTAVIVTIAPSAH
jgi:hypothetical protein